MKNHKIKNISVSPEGPKARSNKTFYQFYDFILIFVENYPKYDPADISRIRTCTGKISLLGAGNYWKENRM